MVYSSSHDTIMGSRSVERISGFLLIDDTFFHSNYPTASYFLDQQLPISHPQTLPMYMKESSIWSPRQTLTKKWFETMKVSPLVVEWRRCLIHQLNWRESSVSFFSSTDTLSFRSTCKIPSHQNPARKESIPVCILVYMKLILAFPVIRFAGGFQSISQWALKTMGRALKFCIRLKHWLMGSPQSSRPSIMPGNETASCNRRGRNCRRPSIFKLIPVT